VLRFMVVSYDGLSTPKWLSSSAYPTNGRQDPAAD
jgi:hypothetical protein